MHLRTRGQYMRTKNLQAGFTLLEVLIALLVLSFGLLGLAALQAYSVKANQSANFRSQATALASMMLDNMRANRANIGSYYSDDYEDVSCGDAPDTSTVAARDLSVWRAQINCVLPARARRRRAHQRQRNGGLHPLERRPMGKYERYVGRSMQR